MAAPTKRARNLFLASMVIIASVSAAMWIASRGGISETSLKTQPNGEPVAIDLDRPLPGQLPPRSDPNQPALPPGHPPIPSTKEPVAAVWSEERLQKMRAPPPGHPTIEGPFKPQKMDDLRDEYGIKKAPPPDPDTVPVPVVIFSTPPGMAVEVNGIVMGITPLIKMLAPGTKDAKVKIRGPGFVTVEKLVRTEEGKVQLAVVMDRVPSR